MPRVDQSTPLYMGGGTFSQQTQGNPPSVGSKMAVKELQSDLNQLIGAGLRVDGIFGPNTTEAVKAFQQRRRITVDGIVGPETKEALRKALPGVTTMPVEPQLPDPGEESEGDTAEESNQAASAGSSLALLALSSGAAYYLWTYFSN